MSPIIVARLLVIHRPRRVAVVVIAALLVWWWVGRETRVSLRLERRKIRGLLLRQALLVWRRKVVDDIWQRMRQVGRIAVSWDCEL